MIGGPPTEPFLDPDNPREIALVPLKRLAGPLVRRSRGTSALCGAVNQSLKSAVREIHMRRSVRAGGG